MQNDATLDDGAPAPGLSALAKLKLGRELGTIKTDIAMIVAGPKAALTKLKLGARANQIRAQLGGGVAPVVVPPPAPEVVPEPEPAPEAEVPEIGELREIVAGKHDGRGLDGLLSRIETCVRALFAGGVPADSTEELAHEAISHWARLEMQTNG